MKRCEICGSPLHRTQKYPNWMLEWILAYLIVYAVIFGVLILAYAVLLWIFR